MSKFRTGFLEATLASALTLVAVSADAADIYRREAPVSYKDTPAYVPVATWTGFYIGANGGYAFDSNNKNPGFQSSDREGGFGGGQIGYNWQGFGLSNLVLGIEADIQGSDISRTVNGDVFGGGTLLDRYTSRVDYFGTVRGRIGYAAGNSLFYATGGFAYGNVSDKLTVAKVGVFKNDDIRTGYAVGGGFEHKFSPSWSLKAEYQYVNLNEDNINGTGFTFNPKDVEMHTVRAGINYHFGQGYEPLK